MAIFLCLFGIKLFGENSLFNSNLCFLFILSSVAAFWNSGESTESEMLQKKWHLPKQMGPTLHYPRDCIKDPPVRSRKQKQTKLISDECCLKECSSVRNVKITLVNKSIGLGNNNIYTYRRIFWFFDFLFNKHIGHIMCTQIKDRVRHSVRLD